jgi:hypothetical protein
MTGESSMDWTITLTQMARSGMWQTAAEEAEAGYRQVSSLRGTQDEAEAEAWALVRLFERAMGVRQ